MTLIEVRQAHKTYRHHGHDVLAVRGVDLTIEPGETLALVGESGCGKSTLGRLLAGTSRATSGDVLLDGRDLYSQCASDRTARRRVQMVFQHPLQSLNPRFSVESTLREPLRLQRGLSPQARTERLRETMGLVGLDAEYLRRRPTELSGGQQQRVALARALMSDPELIVLDEPTSSLDQSVRRRTVALLRQVQERTGVAYLFITHDLATVPQIAHRVAVMYLGRIVEEATPERLFAQPAHPYTRALIAAAPTMTVGRREWEVIRGETPSASDLPRGCAFRDRCPMAIARCAEEAPLLSEELPGHRVECHRAWETPSSSDRPEVMYS
jgi:oligopeptide/dipeptide ABC transporter ATP-binding protein